jgi:hypothetical protein
MLGFSPLAAAPLSDDGIVIVSSSISLSGVASQGSTGSLTLTVVGSKVLTSVASQGSTGSLNLTVVDSETLTSVSSVTAVGSVSTSIVDIQSLVSVSSSTALGTLSLTVTDSETLSSVSSSSQINSLGVQLEDTQLITSVSASSQVGNIVTNIIIPLSSANTTSQVTSLQGTSEDQQLLNSVSSSTQIGTVSTSTSEQDILSGVSSGSSINNISVTVTDLQVLTSAFSSVQVNSVIPKSGIDLTGNSSSVVVNSVSSNGTANETLSTLNSTTQVGSIQIGPSEHLVAVSVTLSVSSLTLSASSNKTVEDVNSALISGNIGVSSSVELSSDSSTSEIGVVTKTASSNLTLVKVTSQTFIDISASGTANTDLSTVSSSTQIPNSLDTEVVVIASIVGVNTTSEVNNVSGIETINADVLLDTKPNLYYSGDTSGGVNYTSSTQYQSSTIGVELYFKLDSNYTTGTTWIFDSQGSKTGWTDQRIYAYLNGNSISSQIKLGNQLGRTASSTFTISPSGGISVDTWYRLHVYQSGQRHYINLYDSSNNIVHSQSQILTISYGSYTTSSYQFFLDDFTVGGNTGGNTFQGLISNFSINAPINLARSLVLYERTTPTWAATGGFTNDATAADVLVFDSPFEETHKVNSGVAVSPLSFFVDSSVILNSATLTGQVGDIDSFNVNSSIGLISVTTSSDLETVTQVHSSNPTIISVPIQTDIEDVDKISTVFLPTSLLGVSLGTVVENLSLTLSSSSSNIVTDNLSVSSSVNINSASSQASVQSISTLVIVDLNDVSLSVDINDLKENLSLSLSTATSALQASSLIIDIDEIIPPALSVSSQVSIGQISIDVSVPTGSVSASISSNSLSGSTQESLDSVVSLLQAGSLTVTNNSSININSVSTASQIAPTLDVNSVAIITGVSSTTAFNIDSAFTGQASPSGASSLLEVGAVIVNITKVLSSASSGFNASDEVKGVINASVQLTTLPLVTVNRGSITLSADGFNFEEFKNAYDRARTVYISRAA